MTTVTPADVKHAMVKYFVDSEGVPAEALADGNVVIETLNIDSLSMIEMLWVLEEKYGVRVEDLEPLKGTTLDGAAEYITSKLRESQPTTPLAAAA